MMGIGFFELLILGGMALLLLGVVGGIVVAVVLASSHKGRDRE